MNKIFFLAFCAACTTASLIYEDPKSHKYYYVLPQPKSDGQEYEPLWVGVGESFTIQAEEPSDKVWSIINPAKNTDELAFYILVETDTNQFYSLKSHPAKAEFQSENSVWTDFDITFN